MPKIDFDNIEVAFAHKSDQELKKAYWIFSLFNILWLNKILNILGGIAFSMKLPLGFIVQNNIFKHFCGGTTLMKCEKTVDLVKAHNVESNLDYSVEAKNSNEAFDKTRNEIVNNINFAVTTSSLTFTSVKITGLCHSSILEKLDAKKVLTPLESEDYEKAQNRLNDICKAAFENKIKLFIDAEESWIQDTIDELTDLMMARYNKEEVIIYNTFQMYRADKLEFLKASLKKAEKIGYLLGAKLVRGAYMEKEAEFAIKNNRANPICTTKEETDLSFDNGTAYCLEHIDKIGLVAATHNELSTQKVIDWMEEFQIEKNNRNVFFAQLYGMSDHISFNIAKEGYNVCKYIPYGPVNDVIPYLIRRAQENTSISGQMGRELSLLKSEMKRRKLI